jgi:amino acid adenylation domain-containing protein
MPKKQLSIENIYGLSPLQQGILFHYLSDPGSGQYIIQQTLKIQGPLKESVVKEALFLLTIRHDALRTSFVVPKSKGMPRQVLFEEREAGFRSEDLRGIDEKAQKHRLADLETKDVLRGFDLEKDPLLRLTFVRLKDSECALILSAHHIILDGWSLPIIMGDLTRYSSALMHGRGMSASKAAALSENRSSTRYFEYIKWLNKQDVNKSLEYWKTLMNGYRDPIGIPPLRKPGPDDSTVRTESCLYSAEFSKKLSAIAADAGVTVSTLLSTAWGLLLARYNHTGDVVFGKVVSGRDIPLTGVEQLAGMFINTVPVRVKTRPGQRAMELLREQQIQSLAGEGHCQCALVDVQKASGKDAGLFSTIFAFENYYVSESSQKGIHGFDITLLSGREQTSYPLSIRANNSDAVCVDAMYDPNIYSNEDIKSLMERYSILLHEIVRNPNKKIAEYSCAGEGERAHIIKNFAMGPRRASPETLSQLFARAADTYAENIALSHNSRTMTFTELNKKANRLAHSLKAIGVGAGSFVLLFCHRSFESIVGMLGILKAGGAYLPVDPKMPDERIRFILKDSEPKAILSVGRQPVLRPGIPCFDLLDSFVYSDDDSEPEQVCKSNDLAYCIYTSGTTGMPKGVMIENKGAVNLARFVAEELGLGSGDRMLQFSHMTFDASVLEIFGALLNGAKLVLIDEETIMDNKRFLDYTNENAITAAVLPPHYYRQSLLPGFKTLLTGGSAASPEIVKRAAASGKYINVYGPTEITVICNYWAYDNNNNDADIPDPVLIGKPLPGMGNYILNGVELCGIGIPGELCVTGEGLARGYLNLPELTSERFIENPYGPGRLYRTGDLARWMTDGNVQFLGRIDEQVKIRGYRIELEDVENALRALPGVIDAVVAAYTDDAGDSAMHAYFTGHTTLDIQELRARLRMKIPAYMVPALFEQIGSIPVKSSGKPDKSALRPITPLAKDIKPPKGDIESKVLEFFKEVLGIEIMGVDQDFFDLGGDSIKAIQIVSRLGALELDVKIRDIFSLRTVENIVADALMRKTNRKKAVVTAQKYCGATHHDLHKISEAILAEAGDMIKIYATEFANAQVDGSGFKDAEVRGLTLTQQATVRMGILGSLGVVLIKAPWDPSRFLAAWNCFLSENHALRSEIKLSEAGCPEGRWRIKRFMPEKIPFIDISAYSWNDQDIIMGELSSRLAVAYMTPEAYMDGFICAHRVICVKTGPDRFFVIMPVSHLVYDGFSGEVFKRRLTAAYINRKEPAVSLSRPMEDYEALLMKGPIGVTDEDIISTLDLEEFNDCVTELRSAREDGNWKYGTFSFPIEGNISQEAILSIGEQLCERALVAASHKKPVAFLLISSARNYTGSNFSDSVGEFIDIVPAVWHAGESFDEVRRRVLTFAREHRINTGAFLQSDVLSNMFPKTTGLLRASIDLENLDVQAVNMLVMYGTQMVILDVSDEPSQTHPNRNAVLNISLNSDSIVIENVKYIGGADEEKFIQESLAGIVRRISA